MVTKDTIIQTLKDKKEKFNISTFILFGSYAKEHYNKDSDVDIAYVEYKDYRLNFDNYLKLEEELQNIFNKKVDLINYKKFNPLIKLHSQKDFIYV